MPHYRYFSTLHTTPLAHWEYLWPMIPTPTSEARQPIMMNGSFYYRSRWPYFEHHACNSSYRYRRARPCRLSGNNGNWSATMFLAHLQGANTITWRPSSSSSVSRARFVTARAIHPKLCACVPPGQNRKHKKCYNSWTDGWIISKFLS
jgi:hypothetical protein